MSTIEVNSIQPLSSGTTITLGANGKTLDVPTGATLDLTGSTVSGLTTGKVLQLVHQLGTSIHSTTSTSYTEVITKAITPTSASSTIYVKFAARTYAPNTSTEHEVQILRDSTLLDTYRGMYTTNGANAQREFWEYYDSSHSTTSSITYKVQHRTMNGNSVVINPNSASDGNYYLTLMEFQT